MMMVIGPGEMRVRMRMVVMIARGVRVRSVRMLV